jgi:fibronectin type 3 domain-containing protein
VVERATTSGGPYTTVGTPTSASFANTVLSPATTYYYVVKATAGAVSSLLSVEFSATTLLGAPTGVLATAVSTSEIDLAWNPVAGATGYVVLRATASGGPYTVIGSPTTTSFANTGLSSATTYYYVVEATDTSGNSANSATVSATTQVAAPTGLVATGKEKSEIDLTWTAVTGATSYVVQRSLVSGGPYATVGTTTTGSFADTGRSEEIFYYYVVEAVNAGGTGPASAEAAGRIP